LMIVSQPRRSLLSTYWHLHAVVQVAQALQVLVLGKGKKVSTWSRTKRRVKMLAIARGLHIRTYTYHSLSFGFVLL
jgi:hypothetical protein